MGKLSKTKGKVGEREFAALIREFGFEARRGQQHRGGADSPDVVTSLPRHHVEVKRCEVLKLWPALAQAERDADPTETPIVAHRPNGKPWIVILDARLYLSMVKRLVELENA